MPHEIRTLLLSLHEPGDGTEVAPEPRRSWSWAVRLAVSAVLFLEAVAILLRG